MPSFKKKNDSFVKKYIGPYKLIRTIAKGGMGEVYLAYDPVCNREIALKCIREELTAHPIIRRRFFREAYIAGKLTHPNIIPIYNISRSEEHPYYTMPYIDGKTFKQILMEAAEKGKEQKNILAFSISALIPVFLTVCEAVSYAHEQKILHRDLKPENILVGKFGEVLIFDWGVAETIDNIAKEEIPIDIEWKDSELTGPGKIIGTLTFMAPERIRGGKATYLTDIYSLGVMLYMILTLKPPFKRKKSRHLKDLLAGEVLLNPIEVAPYRDIPHALARIACKCLAPEPKDRYRDMQELLKDLRSFKEGHSEWIDGDELQKNRTEDWGMQENVLISKHQGISPGKDAVEWICLMISQKAFASNIRIKTKIKLHAKSQGIGLLANAPSFRKNKHIIDGYYLWLSSSLEMPSKLYRNNVEILQIPRLFLIPEQIHKLRFEKVNYEIRFYLNDEKKFSYISYLPLNGGHIGLLYKDDDFKIGPLFISEASPSLVINCLDVPDALFAHKAYDKALIEYRHIAHAFPGRHESREAFFRAGLLLLEKAKNAKRKKQILQWCEESLTEFESLRSTPGAPLEYLGKALVYQELKDNQEELKCLEFAIRRYPDHPLLYLIYDHIIYRMYQSSQKYRMITYQFILLALRYNSHAHRKQMIDPLILNLIDYQRLFFFLETLPEEATEEEKYFELMIRLGFLSGKAYLIEEIFSETSGEPLKRNALICLLLLRKSHSGLLETRTPEERFLLNLPKEEDTEKALTAFFSEVSGNPNDFQKNILYLLFLLKGKPEKAHALLKVQKGKNENRFLYGCYLAGKYGIPKALSFFADEHRLTRPPLSELAISYLSKNPLMKKWLKEAFPFEKSELYKQLSLFYRIGQNPGKAKIFDRLREKIIYDT